MAARLQSLAEPNSIVISPETHRLVGALFEYRDPRHHALKGFAEPVRQVLRASNLENRFEARPVACRCYLALSLWFLGFPDQALAPAQDGLALAFELKHPFSVG